MCVTALITTAMAYPQTQIYTDIRGEILFRDVVWVRIHSGMTENPTEHNITRNTSFNAL